MNPLIDFTQANTKLVVAAFAALMIMLVLTSVAAKRRPRNLNTEHFHKRWKELQKRCASKDTWPLAIIEADKLLDDALKRSRVKGKTMGERMVTVQRQLSNNDSVWYAHKLRNKLVHEEYDNLKERDVKDALIGFRQALKDLGALK